MADANIIVKIVDQTRGGLKGAVANTDKLGQSAKGANTQFLALGAAVKAFAGALAVDKLLQFGDSVQNIQNRIALVNPSLGTAAENFQNVLDIANRTFQPLDAVAGLYQKVARAADDYGLSTAQVNTVTESFTNLLRLAGADAGTAAGAITQFAQALGSGTLRGDELNSVIEATAGEILPLLAEELGVSKGQVRELAAEGKITGDILINALGGGAEGTANKVNDMSVTIGGAITVLKNNFLDLGTNATPVFDAIANAILVVANNLDTAVTFVGTFVAAFAITKLAAIATGIGGITAAVKLMNTAIKANPIGLIATAIATAATLIISNFDDIGATITGIWDGAKTAYLNFENMLLKGVESTVNNVINGFENMGTRTVGFLKAIAKAAMDPLNAMTVFKEEMERVEQQVAKNTNKAVDFSAAIAENDKQIQALTKDTKLNSKETQTNTGKKEDNAETTEGWTDVVSDHSKTTDENSDTIDDNTDAIAAQYKALAQSKEASERATRAVQDSISALKNETFQLGLEENARDDLTGMIELENEKRKELGKDMEDLTEDEIRQLGDLMSERDFVHAEFLTLTDEEIDAYFDARDAHKEKVESIKADLEAKRKAEREAADFVRDTERQIQKYYEETTSKSQQLTDELNEYIATARQQGKENDKEVQDAIRSYRFQINQAMIDEHQDMIDEQKSQVQGFRDEYNHIYDDIFDGLEKLTGKSQSELEKFNQYFKLFTGTDLLGSFTGFVDNSLMSLSGFNTTGQGYFNTLNTQGSAAMGQLGNATAMPFMQGGVAYNGIGGFIGYALNALGANGGGLLGAVLALFNTGLGGGLQNIFSNVFGYAKNILGGVGNFLGDIWGGITNIGSNIFSGVGSFFGDIFDGIGNFFGGLFEDGGYIKPGTFGIVGEAGAELVRGPATVTSARDTADMMMGGGNVNVNFSINAVDARGIDQLLIERKALIADVVRDAVATSGRRI